MQSPDHPPVNASSDALDEPGFDAAPDVWQQADAEDETDSASHRRKLLRKLKAENRFLRGEETISTNKRASHAARAYDRIVRRKHTHEPDFFEWQPNRALARQDFDYLFFHRQRFNKKIRTWLEIVASKITHFNEDGKCGYFNKLEQNVGWVEYITPLLFTGVELVDKLVRCGLWANSHNSRRCHKPDFCALCLWNDVVKVLAAAFGSAAGAFFKAPAWWFITVGWTSNARNAKCVSGDYSPDDLKPPKGDGVFDPYPVVLGLDDYDPDCAWVAYQDARLLGLVMQEAVRDLYQRQLVDGFHYKLEAACRLHPGGANRVNLHCHSVANGREEDGNFIAQELERSVVRLLSKSKHRLNRQYFVDIQVKNITSPEHLQNAICYSEKIVAVKHMVADALCRPEAKLPNGSWNAAYMSGLTTSLMHLVLDDVPGLFSGACLEPDLPRLFRRKTAGNMRFTDDGRCIGDEPGWHQLARRNHATKQRQKRRERRKKKEAALRKQGRPVPAQKQYPRRRKNLRPLARSLSGKQFIAA